MRSSRPILAFARPINNAAMIAAIGPSTVTPGSRYAATPTAIAVMMRFTKNPMVVE